MMQISLLFTTREMKRQKSKWSQFTTFHYSWNELFTTATIEMKQISLLFTTCEIQWQKSKWSTFHHFSLLVKFNGKNRNEANFTTCQHFWNEPAKNEMKQTSLLFTTGEIKRQKSILSEFHYFSPLFNLLCMPLAALLSQRVGISHVTPECQSFSLALIPSARAEDLSNAQYSDSPLLNAMVPYTALPCLIKCDPDITAVPKRDLSVPKSPAWSASQNMRTVTPHRTRMICTTDAYFLVPHDSRWLAFVWSASFSKATPSSPANPPRFPTLLETDAPCFHWRTANQLYQNYNWKSGQNPHPIKHCQEKWLQYIKLCTICGSWLISEFFLNYTFICLVTIFITGVNIGWQRFSSGEQECGNSNIRKKWWYEWRASGRPITWIHKNRMSHPCCVFPQKPVGWACVAQTNGNNPLKHGTSHNFDITALLQTWSYAPMGQHYGWRNKNIDVPCPPPSCSQPQKNRQEHPYSSSSFLTRSGDTHNKNCQRCISTYSSKSEWGWQGLSTLSSNSSYRRGRDWVHWRFWPSWTPAWPSVLAWGSRTPWTSCFWPRLPQALSRKQARYSLSATASAPRFTDADSPVTATGISTSCCARRAGPPSSFSHDGRPIPSTSCSPSRLRLWTCKRSWPSGSRSVCSPILVRQSSVWGVAVFPFTNYQNSVGNSPEYLMMVLVLGDNLEFFLQF